MIVISGLNFGWGQTQSATAPPDKPNGGPHGPLRSLPPPQPIHLTSLPFRIHFCQHSDPSGCRIRCLNLLEIAACYAKLLREIGWGGRIRTYDTRYQKPLPYHLATPQNRVPELKVGDSMVQPPICRPELLFHLCSFWKSTHSFRTVRT